MKALKYNTFPYESINRLSTGGSFSTSWQSIHKLKSKFVSADSKEVETSELAIKDLKKRLTSL